MGPSSPDPSHDRRTIELVRGVQQGQVEEFGRLYERIAPALFTWAKLRIRPSYRGFLDPDDVLQEVWLRAIQIFDSFDPKTRNFRYWIFAVAKNVLLEAFRKLNDPAIRAAADGHRISKMRQRAVEVTRISERVAGEEAVALFLQKVEELDPEHRKLVIYCGLEGLKHAEVAEMMALNVETVTKRWQRLRARLAETSYARELLVDEAA